MNIDLNQKINFDKNTVLNLMKAKEINGKFVALFWIADEDNMNWPEEEFLEKLNAGDLVYSSMQVREFAPHAFQLFLWR